MYRGDGGWGCDGCGWDQTGEPRTFLHIRRKVGGVGLCSVDNEVVDLVKNRFKPGIDIYWSKHKPRTLSSSPAWTMDAIEGHQSQVGTKKSCQHGSDSRCLFQLGSL